jgi:SPP1 family predicted phage head-tail adaptor
MRSGRLDQQITVQRYTSTIDDYGVPTMAWSDLVTVRAQIIQQSTTEFIQNGARDDTVVIFRCRWITDITTADRIAFNGIAHNVKELKPIGRQKGLDIRCVAGDEIGDGEP